MCNICGDRECNGSKLCYEDLNIFSLKANALQNDILKSIIEITKGDIIDYFLSSDHLKRFPTKGEFFDAFEFLVSISMPEVSRHLHDILYKDMSEKEKKEQLSSFHERFDDPLGIHDYEQSVIRDLSQIYNLKDVFFIPENCVSKSIN